jgi:ketosteroid isomerase-like protein
MYAAFNQRDIESVLAAMHDNVDWPNGMEGGRVPGKAAVREYWKRQFEVLDPNVEPRNFTKGAADGSQSTCIRWFTIKAGNSSWIRWFSTCTKFETG